MRSIFKVMQCADILPFYSFLAHHMPQWFRAQIVFEYEDFCTHISRSVKKEVQERSFRIVGIRIFDLFSLRWFTHEWKSCCIISEFCGSFSSRPVGHFSMWTKTDQTVAFHVVYSLSRTCESETFSMACYFRHQPSRFVWRDGSWRDMQSTGSGWAKDN